MVFVMVVRSSCLDCRYFVIGFSICKNCSNIKSYPPLAKGIPLQLTLGTPYLTNHIGVDCCWHLVRETESLLYWYSPVKDKKNFVSKISLLFIRLFIPWLLMASRKHTTKVYTCWESCLGELLAHWILAHPLLNKYLYFSFLISYFSLLFNVKVWNKFDYIWSVMLWSTLFLNWA